MSETNFQKSLSQCTRRITIGMLPTLRFSGLEDLGRLRKTLQYTTVDHHRLWICNTNAFSQLIQLIVRRAISINSIPTLHSEGAHHQGMKMRTEISVQIDLVLYGDLPLFVTAVAGIFADMFVKRGYSAQTKGQYNLTKSFTFTSKRSVNKQVKNILPSSFNYYGSGFYHLWKNKNKGKILLSLIAIIRFCQLSLSAYGQKKVGKVVCQKKDLFLRIRTRKETVLVPTTYSIYCNQVLV